MGTQRVELGDGASHTGTRGDGNSAPLDEGNRYGCNPFTIGLDCVEDELARGLPAKRKFIGATLVEEAWGSFQDLGLHACSCIISRRFVAPFTAFAGVARSRALDCTVLDS